jgi:hypothetical protein
MAPRALNAETPVFEVGVARDRPRRIGEEVDASFGEREQTLTSGFESQR